MLRGISRVVKQCDPRPPCFIGMPQRSLASLVLGPLLTGVLCLALACVAGARTDRLSDTIAAADSARAVDSAHVADTLRRVDSVRAADADSAAASQLAVVVDSATLKQGAAQQGTASSVQPSNRSSCCVSMHLHRHGDRPLSPLADSIANGLVFVPRDRNWFPVASRGRHMLVDIGRIDVTLKSDSLTRAAYVEAVTRLSPLPLGTVLRVRGPYSVDEQAKITGFDSWHGRIVARLGVSHLLDSLARAEDMLPAAATRIDTVVLHADTTHHPGNVTSVTTGGTTPAPTRPDSLQLPITPMACTRDTLPTELTTRAIAVRDSLVQFLTDSATPPYDRQIATAKVQSWWVPGCFGIGRALIIANKRTPDMDFAVERVAVLDSAGKTVPMKFLDFRFHAHDPLYVFDADGDGVDDLAARGHGDRSGGLTIMRLDIAARRFVRLVSGFAWEQ